MKAVIFVAEGTQDEEFLYPYYRLQEENFNVIVVAAGPVAQQKGKMVVYGKYKIPLPVNDISSNLAQEHYKDTDLLIVPGGWQGPEIMRLDRDMRLFVQYMDENGRTIGAICHGPWVLISAHITDGRSITGYEGIGHDIMNSGARYIEAPVVVDKNLVTSPHYRNNPEFMKAVLENVRRRTG